MKLWLLDSYCLGLCSGAPLASKRIAVQTGLASWYQEVSERQTTHLHLVVLSLS